MYAYLEHLFCEAESIIDGVVCQDKYTTPGVLTDDISTRKLSETRKILIKEHSARRVQRGLGGLKESDILNTIAQNYANILCAAGYITHEFNGSKLEERYDAGGYVYDF